MFERLIQKLNVAVRPEPVPAEEKVLVSDALSSSLNRSELEIEYAPLAKGRGSRTVQINNEQMAAEMEINGCLMHASITRSPHRKTAIH
jgi:hypothetical protein